jgi:RNA polymerase sigma factor (sigma-70 family)
MRSRIAPNAKWLRRFSRIRLILLIPALRPRRRWNKRRAYLYRSVDALPADQRRVILLRFTGEKSIREIAGELGRSEGAIKQLQVRALENLRARMEEAYG